MVTLCRPTELENSLDQIYPKVLPHIFELGGGVQGDVGKPVVEEAEQALQVSGGHLVEDQEVGCTCHLDPRSLSGLHLGGIAMIKLRVAPPHLVALEKP